MPRVGTKRSDRRWKDRDGNIWDSKFERNVYKHFEARGSRVRRCTENDAISYIEPKARVNCMDCGSNNCGQERVYTPDLFVVPKGAESDSAGYYVEAKGYFRREKRKLFRCLRKARPDVDLRCVLESDHWVTKGKTRLTDYFKRYLKTTPVVVGVKNIPEEWL